MSDSSTTKMVQIKHKETGVVGTCPVGAVDLWTSRGYEVVTNDVAEVATQEDTQFDPSGEGVTAKAVAEYLAGLDTATAAGRNEYDRVVTAEAAGQNRSTAIPS